MYPDRQTLCFSAAWLVPCAGGSAPAHPEQPSLVASGGRATSAGNKHTVCQIGVFLAYASRHGHALIDRALYLPETWAFDAARRAEAGVPEEVGFTTKPKLGQAMLKQAFAAGVPCRWVVGDCVYGADHQTRRLIEAHGRGYVLAVTSAQRLGLKRTPPVPGWKTGLLIRRKKG